MFRFFGPIVRRIPMGPKAGEIGHAERTAGAEAARRWCGMRRFTRLTSAFPKKIEDLLRMLSLWFVH